jgi:antilisterial bacteriocin subtilosin biosynthesis protein AlbA
MGGVAVELESAADKYVHLAGSASLHVAPALGVVQSLATGETVFVGRCARELLARCDGTVSVRGLAEGALGRGKFTEDELGAALVELAHLAALGLLVLTPDPALRQPAMTGDLQVHYPLNLQVELTARCNLRCFYCYRGSSPGLKEDRLSTEELMAILDRLHGLGLQSVELTGGEPMVHKDFVDILKFCGSRFRMIALMTNGTCVTPRALDAMLPLREKMILSVSLDSHIAEVHDQRRGRKGAFARTTRAIRLLADHGFRLRVSMVVDEETWTHLEPTLLLARKLGASMFSYTPLLPMGRGIEHFRPWDRDARAIRAQEEELREKYGSFLHDLGQRSLADLKMPGGCGAGYRTYAMDPQGRIRPCVTFDQNSAIFGSLREKSPEEVFGSSLGDAFAAVTPPQPDVCGRCEHRAFCQNCLMRGLDASRWIPEGECAWLRESTVAAWHESVLQHSMFPEATPEPVGTG